MILHFIPKRKWLAAVATDFWGIVLLGVFGKWYCSALIQIAQRHIYQALEKSFAIWILEGNFCAKPFGAFTVLF